MSNLFNIGELEQLFDSRKVEQYNKEKVVKAFSLEDLNRVNKQSRIAITSIIEVDLEAEEYNLETARKLTSIIGDNTHLIKQLAYHSDISNPSTNITYQSFLYGDSSRIEKVVKEPLISIPDKNLENQKRVLLLVK